MGEPVELVPQFKTRVRTATTATVVAGSTDRERPAQPLDHNATVGLVRPGDQGDHDLSPLLRAERGISSSRLKTFFRDLYTKVNIPLHFFSN